MEKDTKKKIYRFLAVVCAIVVVISVGLAVKYFIDKANSMQEAKTYEELAESVNAVSSEYADSDQETDEDSDADEDEKSDEDADADADAEAEKTVTDPNAVLADRGIEIPAKNLNFEELKAVNSDIYAWIYVPGTAIDYPLLQSADDNEYYLMHNLDGSEGYPGCIFTQNYSSKDFSSGNTLVYGHNMKDGSMFATLFYYKDKSFFDENRFIYVYTEDFTYVYEIFGAYYFDDSNLSLAYDYSTSDAILGYLNMVLSQRDMSNNFLSDFTPDGNSHIITLSTCVDAISDGQRYLVAGVLVNDRYRE